MDIEKAISDIVRINTRICEFWGKGARGWAPPEAEELLSKSRLDWQVSLSRTLTKWCDIPEKDEHDGHLILAWANLGALVEGTMKWFLCVYANNYADNPVKNKKKVIEPDDLFFHSIITFFKDKIWALSENEENEAIRQSMIQRNQEWEIFSEKVRVRRNAIHAYQDREIGSLREFHEAIITYKEFLLHLEGRVVYPDAEDY